MAGLGHVATDAKGTKDETRVQDAPGRGRDARKPRLLLKAKVGTKGEKACGSSVLKALK